MDESIRISPKYKVRDWKALTFNTEQDWQTMADIVEDRISGRFLDVLTHIQKGKFARFAVLALDCLLIETLQQFREGKRETPKGKSKEYFVKFLTETSFKKWFGEDTAMMFYYQIRCGILHQAETKGTSRIVTTSGVPLIKKIQDGPGLVINRKLFHAEAERVFKHYVDQLRDSGDEELRNFCRRKMNYICNVSLPE